MTRVLVLRPEPGASATLKKARALGLDAFAVSLFEVGAIAWQAPDPSGFDGLLLTSANAVRFGGEALHELHALPVYAVGEATADAARRAGFDIAFTGEAGVDHLLASIEPDVRLLHLCGEERREPERPSQRIIPIAIYRSRAVDRPDLSRAGGSIALIHSPRAGQRFAELVGDRAAISIAAVSRPAAEAVGRGWVTVEVADEPNDDALLALATRLCKKSPPK